MAHEITQTDNVVLTKERAWHGLGTIVENAPTPSEALETAGLDWEVEQWPLSASNGEGSKLALPSHVANVRTDTNEVLGIVGDSYQPIQNRELAEFCESIAEGDDIVTCETAGSIRGGAKVWILLRGESLSVRDSDEIKPYICVSNGHDGKTSFRATPTTVRVVCSNTLHMVIPRRESDQLTRSLEGSFRAFHNGNVLDKVEQAKAALKLYGKSLESTREMIDQLTAKEVNREEIQQFFLECYTRDFGSVPVNPQDKQEQRLRDRAMDACNLVMQRFEDERQLAGATAWNMFNAYSGWLQNDRPTVNWKDEGKAQERAISTKLFGVDSERTSKAFELALSV